MQTTGRKEKKKGSWQRRSWRRKLRRWGEAEEELTAGV
ncbi:uncharacterized protein G2W53_017524 [Senna tora]|uniref:Uncharacterized protein n=1 Tax=Senna tora TaxID=362788 RepID=A0A834TU76_9FABA|nr:uncharacterized protein G2W53_017524 [Senna tora]